MISIDYKIIDNNWLHIYLFRKIKKCTLGLFSSEMDKVIIVKS